MLIKLGKISKARSLLKTQNNSPCIKSKQKIYVDLSVISMNDAGTGIQRLVKSVWQGFQESNYPHLSFVPIYATRKKKYALSRYPEKNIKWRNYVHLKNGDTFFGLDWSANQIIQHKETLFYWKQNGAKLIFIVNDILALRHPEWFTKKNSKKLEAWLEIIAVCADELICVSDVVKKDVELWLKENSISTEQLPCSSIRLGGEIQLPTINHTINKDMIKIIYRMPFILKVATIEPRKGHLIAIQAFEHLWKKIPTLNYSLILVGQYGWKSEKVIEYIKSSEFYGKKLFWFDNINDSELIEIYKAASGVINASKGEGFGLPLMEAIFFKKPLFVRDLPVFREVTSNRATYFKNDDKEYLSNLLIKWIKNIEENSLDQIPFQSWSMTLKSLLERLSKK